MISHNTLLKIALEEARKSDHKHRIGCVIFDKNTIMSRGFNVSLMNRKKLHPRFRRWPNSIHAEVNAIINARTDLNGADIFIIRINRYEELLLARPCDHCMSYLQYVGIKKVIFSVKNGFEEESL